MSATGLVTFDKTLQVTNIWLNELAEELGWDDRHKVFQALRITLHGLRDRISVNQASKLAAQLPVLLVGFFYEDWQPAATPHKERTKAAFFAHMNGQLEEIYPDIDSEYAVKAVFRLLAKKISPGEIEDIKSMLPKSLRALWPVAVQA
ncbi:hypothetical protein S7335_98 [Synechococcus sp. PCC 7335]|uniref:DUF2267 domain-containing protein n=1 Tax=Synechococcus sp. (strain ATCC 29403 / PCC 7335) TaxID=91464 RepID=UPI00017ECF00|nr:DUF2267 domain-containing protein [Synechococcus sp. PCC 7335]EDX82920.1 hypothetical protein S7335_98 [Synechococcus sp. PCC 7335]